MKNSSKAVLYLMHGIFIMLIILSIFLYKQRFFADSAYFFFHSINSGWFHIEHSRLLLGFSQIIPIIGYHLGLPLKHLMLSYSAGVELIYYLLFIFLVYKLKDLAAGVSLLLIHLIGQLWLFHVPSLEICHGAALAIVFYSILRSGKYKDDKWLILLLLIEWLILFSHPANLFLIPFLIAFDYLNRGWQQRIHLSIIFFFFIGVVIRLVSMGQYDQAKLQNSNGIFTSGAIDSNYWPDVFQVFVEFYPELLVFMLIILSYFIFKRALKKIALFLGSLVILIVLISAIERINQFGFYTEALISPIVFLIVFIVLHEVWKNTSATIQSLGLIFFVGIAIFRVFWILDFGKTFDQREQQLNHLVDYAQTVGHSKLLLKTDNFAKSYSLINWANPIETLLFSAIDGKEASVTIATEEDLDFQNNRKNLTDSSFIFRMFDVMPHSFLNERFFKFNTSSYYELNTADYVIDPSEIKDAVSISFYQPKEGLIFQKGDTIIHEVYILNKSGSKIPSGIEGQTFIACHWYNKDGSTYRWDGIRTLLEVDVLNSYTQDIRLAIPEKSGEYLLQADLVIEGLMWFGLQQKVLVQVK
tara:strand:- start:2910 stop:4664 length:1755 start_codon:yes stop_codon:yes gene_type:complete